MTQSLVSQRLNELSDEVDVLLESGQWNREHFDRIMAEARKVTVDGDRLQFVWGWAEPEWREPVQVS
jgi:hypothetical protein